MKKPLIVIIAFLFVFKISNAQTEKGTQTLGLNLTIANDKSTNSVVDPGNFSVTTQTSKNTGFSIGPNYSYFIADKLDIGGSLSYSSGTYNSSYSYTTTNANSNQVTHSYGGEIYIRKYFMYQDKIGLRAGPYLSYFRGDEKSVSTPAASYDGNTTTNNFNAGANLDLVYYPSKKVGFAATIVSLGYSSIKSNGGDNIGNTTENNFNFNLVTDGLEFSVFYVFGGK